MSDTPRATEPEGWTVRTFSVRTPVTDGLAADMGADELLALAKADATDRLAVTMAGRPFRVLGAESERVDLLPGHTLGGFDPDTGEPLGPPGHMLVTRLRVASPDWREGE